MVKAYIDKLKKNYVINKVKRTKIPGSNGDSINRKKIVFSGKVQKVGFRLEVYEMAKAMGLTGWVKNAEDGNVYSEIQGPNNRIQFLINNMKNLKRAKVTHIDILELPTIDNEEDFVIIKENSIA